MSDPKLSSSKNEVYRGFSMECVHAIARALQPFLQGHPGWHHFNFEVQLDERGVETRGISFGLSETDGWTWTLVGAYTPIPTPPETTEQRGAGDPETAEKADTPATQGSGLLATRSRRQIDGAALSSIQKLTPYDMGPWGEWYQRKEVDAEIERLRKQVSDEDVAHTKTIEERDRVEAYADQLAEMIGVFCEVEIGEHSSANCPWENAIEAMRVAIGKKQSPGETLCDGWQPIDTVPPNLKVLTYRRGFDGNPLVDTATLESFQCASGMHHGNGVFFSRVTHWMPLPDAPVASMKAGEPRS